MALLLLQPEALFICLFKAEPFARNSCVGWHENNLSCHRRTLSDCGAQNSAPGKFSCSCKGSSRSAEDIHALFLHCQLLVVLSTFVVILIVALFTSLHHEISTRNLSKYHSVSRINIQLRISTTCLKNVKRLATPCKLGRGRAVFEIVMQLCTFLVVTPAAP